MKVHSSDLTKYRKGPAEFPSNLLSEDMAQYNHSQSLERLNSRGGLGYDEIVCNILGVDLRFLQNNKDLDYCYIVTKLLEFASKATERGNGY